MKISEMIQALATYQVKYGDIDVECRNAAGEMDDCRSATPKPPWNRTNEYHVELECFD